MSAIVQEMLLRYPFPSQFVREDGGQGDGGRHLRLATFCENVDHESNDLKNANHQPFFFQATLARPQRTATLLRALMTVVQSRFHIPAAMLSRILAESDPVVTGNEDQLRFEGFSACCGVYVRTDLLADAFSDASDDCNSNVSFGRGTTNVDFNQPMLAALARLRPNEQVTLAVGQDRVALKRTTGDVVEKKVKLPLRWLKGFVEAQAVQSRMQKVHSIDGLQAYRFLRSLPRMKTHRRATFVVSSGKGLRLSQVEASDCVRVGGLERLAVLEPMSRDAIRLDVYTDPLTDASGWVLSLSDSRFSLVLSPEVWRGFSGEGQALESLAASDRSALPKVRAMLKWQSEIDLADIARRSELSKAKVDTALKMLGTQGIVGFDLERQSYFHRELPFDVSQVEKLQPRLIAARKLIDEDHVKIHKQTKSSAEVRIQSRDVEHRVQVRIGKSIEYKCTCPWFNQHENSRGPCKHILAAQISLEELVR